MKTKVIATAIKSNVTPFVISFIIAFSAAWLVFNHLQHTILAGAYGSGFSETSFYENSGDDFTVSSTPQTTPDNTADANGGGCPCPACCAAQSLPL